MTPSAAEVTQREEAYQRWADDGGRAPDQQPTVPEPTTLRNPWGAVAVAVGLGFALGWVTGRR